MMFAQRFRESNDRSDYWSLLFSHSLGNPCAKSCQVVSPHASRPPVAVPQLNRSAWWTCAAGVIGLHVGATQVAVVILVRFQHDLVRDSVSAPICDRFLLRHDPVVVCIALLEICQPAGITAGPFQDGHAAVVIRIARSENFDDEIITRFVA